MSRTKVLSKKVLSLVGVALLLLGFFVIFSIDFDADAKIYLNFSSFGVLTLLIGYIFIEISRNLDSFIASVFAHRVCLYELLYKVHVRTRRAKRVHDLKVEKEFNLVDLYTYSVASYHAYKSKEI